MIACTFLSYHFLKKNEIYLHMCHYNLLYYSLYFSFGTSCYLLCFFTISHFLSVTLEFPKIIKIKRTILRKRNQSRSVMNLNSASIRLHLDTQCWFLILMVFLISRLFLMSSSIDAIHVHTLTPFNICTQPYHYEHLKKLWADKFSRLMHLAIDEHIINNFSRLIKSLLLPRIETHVAYNGKKH